MVLSICPDGVGVMYYNLHLSAVVHLSTVELCGTGFVLLIAKEDYSVTELLEADQYEICECYTLSESNKKKDDLIMIFLFYRNTTIITEICLCYLRVMTKYSL